MCTAIERDCPCNGCQDELEAFYDCYITDLSDGDCYYLNCDAYETWPTNPPVPTPHPSPTEPVATPPTVPTIPDLGATNQPPEVAPMSSESSSANIGPIIGGAIGGLLAICVTIFGVFYMQRKDRSEPAKSGRRDPTETDGLDYPPRTTEASPVEPSVSVYATPVSHQPAALPHQVPGSPPARPRDLQGSAGHSPARVPKYSSRLSRPSYGPNFKDQARSVAPPVSVVPTVEATPMNDSNRNWSPQRSRAPDP